MIISNQLAGSGTAPEGVRLGFGLKSLSPDARPPGVDAPPERGSSMDPRGESMRGKSSTNSVSKNAGLSSPAVGLGLGSTPP